MQHEQYVAFLRSTQTKKSLGIFHVDPQTPQNMITNTHADNNDLSIIHSPMQGILQILHKNYTVLVDEELMKPVMSIPKNQHEHAVG